MVGVRHPSVGDMRQACQKVGASIPMLSNAARTRAASRCAKRSTGRPGGPLLEAHRQAASGELVNHRSGFCEVVGEGIPMTVLDHFRRSSSTRPPSTAIGPRAARATSGDPDRRRARVQQAAAARQVPVRALRPTALSWPVRRNRRCRRVPDQPAAE